jgi:hypothetical protein
MSASPPHYRKPATKCVTVLTPFLRHLNTGTLAFVLFVALALLNPVRGTQPETRESAHAREAEPELANGRPRYLTPGRARNSTSQIHYQRFRE